MINTRIRYIVYNHNGTGVRHHHFTTSNDIIAEADGHASATDNIVAQGFPFQWFGGQTVPFAFMSVHGAADGNHLYTSPGNQNVAVGSSDVDILVVYAPPGGIGGPNGGPGVWVDAFDVDAGDFSDDLNFIQVLTPPTPPDSVDSAKTTYANNEGVVSTLAAEDIRASTSVDSGIPFLEWKKIVPSESLDNMREVNLMQNESGEIWLAFYQTPTGGGPVPPRNYQEGTWVSWGVMVDGGGPTGAGPVPPWNPFVMQLAAGLALADAAGKVSPKLQADVLDLAARQISIAAKAIENEMQAGTKLVTLAAKKKGAQVSK
jgi:hypothetical protein